MTYDQFWYGEPYLVKAYRKAHDLRNEMTNHNAWLQGLYDFIAIGTAISNIHLDGKKHKTNEYINEPIKFIRTDEDREREAEKQRQKAIASLTAFANAWNNTNKKGK